MGHEAGTQRYLRPLSRGLEVFGSPGPYGSIQQSEVPLSYVAASMVFPLRSWNDNGMSHSVVLIVATQWWQAGQLP